LKNEREAIETSVGIISGRDAIYLDKLEILPIRFGMVFTGELNGDLCSQNDTGKEWIPYRILFDCEIYHSSCEIDLYFSKERDLVSSFDIIAESDLLNDIYDMEKSCGHSNTYSHYVLATYNCVFEIIAGDFKFELM